MRIGFDAKRYFNNSSGLGNYSRQLIHDLNRFNQHGDLEIHLFHNKKVNSSYPLHIPKVSSPIWRTWGMGQSASNMKMDVFHGLSNELPLDLPKGILKVVTIHDVIFKQLPQNYNWIDRSIYNLKTKYSLQKADKVIATSYATLEQIQKYYPLKDSKCEVIYQAVDERYYSGNDSSNNEKNFFIYTSSFTNRKNHLNLIKAFNLTKNKHDWNLKLIGLKGETSKRIVNEISNLAIEDRVEIIENASLERMVLLMNQAKAFVYPSVFEGFGIPLAEAAAVGLPMAVSNISVFNELAGDSSFYFDPMNVVDIADQMMKLTNPENSRKQLQFRDTLLQKINSEHIVNQLIKIYNGN